MSIRSGSSH